MFFIVYISDIFQLYVLRFDEIFSVRIFEARKRYKLTTNNTAGAGVFFSVWIIVSTSGI
jgi:hypothetical protein